MAVSLALRPKYLALSYNWGAAEKSHTIFDHGKPILVTASVQSALQHLRHSDLELVMWIDAICIDQNSNDERSAQVSIMTEIYQGAEEVWIWLGEETKRDQAAFSLLRTYQDRFEEYGFFEIGVDVETDAKMDLLEDRQDEWDGLQEFFQKPYFERVWIIQEIVKARRAKVFCGSLSTNWDVVANVSRSLQRFGMVGNQTIEDMVMGCASVYALTEMKNAAVVEVLPTLESTRYHKATDPRDKYFALLGVITVRAEAPLEIDYSKSVQTVYTEIAVHNLTTQKTLRNLSSAGIRSTMGNISLPSWVPDWSYDNAGRFNIGSHGCFNATGSSDPIINVSPDNKTLTVRGYIIDSMLGVSPFARDVGQGKAFQNGGDKLFQTLDSSEPGLRFSKEATKAMNRERSLLQSAYHLLSLVSKYPPGQDLEEVLWRTLGCDMTVEFEHPAPPTFGEAWKFFREIMYSFDEFGVFDEGKRSNFAVFVGRFEPREFMRIVRTGMKMGIGRRVCITAAGYFGHAPCEAEENDLVALLLGADVPFLIRPRGDGYYLVGECYVHGIMGGEAMGMCISEGREIEDIRLS